MNTIRLLSVAAAMAAAMGVAGSTSAYVIYDGSFEFPNVHGGDAYDPIIGEGGFSGDAGVDGGAFSYATPPDGKQDGFLQTVAGGAAEIDLVVHGLTIGDSYSFSYYDAQRSGYGLLPYTVSVDGTSIYAGSASSTAFTMVTTASFTATNTDSTLTFFAPNLPAGDDDTAIDAVIVDGDGSATTYGVPTVPEPASWALMLVGFGAAGAAVRSRRRAIAA